MMRCALLAIVLVPTACGAEAFACGDDGQCMLGGEPGVCVTGSCAYPDAMCPSGYRYAAGLGSVLAGQCVAEGDVPGSGTETEAGSSGSMSTTSTTVDPSTSTTTAASTTSTSTGSVEVSGDPTSVGPMTTTDSATTFSSTGPSVCGEGGCEACLECALEKSCAVVNAECLAQDACIPSQQCLQGCVSNGGCADCCTGVPNPALMSALAVLGCQEMVCQDECMFPASLCKG